MYRYDENSYVDPTNSEEAIDELENIRGLLHDAKRRINRNKLEKSDIDLTIMIFPYEQ